MLPFKSRPGAVEPLSLVALVLLVVTLVVGTAVTSNTRKSFEIRREGSVLQATSGCGLDRFGECGGTCGGGTCGWQGSICGCIYPTPTPTPRPAATPVPTSPPAPTSTCDPDAWSAWSTCSAGCGGGTQSRTNQCGTRQTQSCNTQSCFLPSPTPTPVPVSYTCTTNGGYCSPEGCGSDTCGSGTCAAGKSCCKACPLPTPTSIPSGGGGTQPTPTPTATQNTCSYTCTSSGICSAEGGTAIVSQVCSSGQTCCNFQTQQPSSPAGQSPLGGASPTPAWAAPAGQSPLGGASPAPRPTAVPGSTTTAPITPPTTSSSGQCFWGASTCSAFGRYSGSGCTNCPSGVASCCGVVIPASADACLNSVGQHVDYRCVSSIRVAVCKSDKSGYNTQDCAGGWSCNASTGRCAPPPTPTPVLNFNPQTALTPQGTYTVNSVSPTFDTLDPSRSIDYKKYEDACKGKTSGTVCSIDGQAGTCSQGAVPLCELVKGPIGGNLVQYRNLAQQAEAAVMGTVSNLPLVGPNRIYQSLQIAASGSQYSIEAMPSDPYGIAGVEIGAVDVALAHYAGLTEIVDASNRLFYQTGLSESQAQEYNAYVANRFGDAATVGTFAVGTAAQITSPFINPETLAGKPISSTYNSVFARNPTTVAYDPQAISRIAQRTNRQIELSFPESPNVPGCRRGLCGLSSDYAKAAAANEGLEAQTFQVESLNKARGASQSARHAITVVTDTQGNRHLVDVTFGQFINPDTGVFIERKIAGGPLLPSSGATINTPVVRSVLTEGYFPLTDESLTQYLNALTPGGSGPATTLDILRQVMPFDDARNIRQLQQTLNRNFP